MSRPRWHAWWWRIALLCLLTAASLLALGSGLYRFLAVTAPVEADTLVVDGWLPTYNLALAADEFRRGKYRRVIVVRAFYPAEAVNHDPGNLALLQQILVRFGVPRQQIVGVTFPGLRRDRTQAAARAVVDWFSSARLPLPSLDVFTLGPHARRSRLVFARVCGAAVRIGVVASPDASYDPAHWWDFSDGIREVPFEGLAYLRARL